MANASGNQPKATQGGQKSGPLHYFRVVVKQIDRLHEIDALLVDVAGRASHSPNCFLVKNVDFTRTPATVFQQWAEKSKGNLLASSTSYEMECFGDDGRKVTPGKLDEPVDPRAPGAAPTTGGHDLRAGSVRCTIERKEWGPKWCNRTFDRKRSSDVDTSSWVYVLRTLPHSPRKAEVIRELQYDAGGKFRFVIPDRAKERALAQQPNADSATARAKDLDQALKVQTALDDLSLEHPETGRPAEYYFYLARWRLPWPAVEALENNPAELAVRLGDLFHTDVYEAEAADGLAKAEPLLAVPKRPPVPFVTEPTLTTKKKPAYVLHLVDPFLEAHKRSDDLGRCIDALEPAQNQQPDSARHQFARHLELFTSASEDDRALISEKLYAYLYFDGGFERIQAIWQMIHSRAYEVVSWVGQKERRHLEEAHWDGIHHRRGAELHVEGKGPPQTGWTGEPVIGKHPRPSDKWTNAYATALSFYATAASVLLRKAVDADCTAKSRILETSIGQTYLDRDLAVYLARSPELQLELGIDKQELGKWKARGHVDASGLDLVLTAKTALSEEAELWDKVNGIYSASWGRKLKAFTLKLERHGSSLLGQSMKASRSVSDLRRVNEAASGELEVKAAKLVNTLRRRAGLTTIKYEESAALKLSKVGAAGTNAFVAGLGVWVALVNLRDAKTVHARFVASGELAGAIKSVVEETVSLRNLVANTTTKVPFVKGLGVYATAVDVISSGWSVLESHDGGQAVGRSITFLASLLAVYGSAFTTGGVSLVIQGVCMALKFVGNTVATEYDDTSRYLRACDFGDPRWKKGEYYLPLFFDDVGNKYLKAKRETAWTVADQHQALRGLMYAMDYEPKIEAYTTKLEVLFTPWYKQCFTADVKWAGTIDVKLEAIDLFVPLNSNTIEEKERVVYTNTGRVVITDENVRIDAAGLGYTVHLGQVHRPNVDAILERVTVECHLELTVPGDVKDSTSVVKYVWKKSLDRRRSTPMELPVSRAKLTPSVKKV